MGHMAEDTKDEVKQAPRPLVQAKADTIEFIENKGTLHRTGLHKEGVFHLMVYSGIFWCELPSHACRLAKSMKNSTSAFFSPQILAQKTCKSINIQIRDKTA